MDQRTHDVEEDLKNILHTRLALAEKMRRLEKRVHDTIEGTKAAALDAVDLAKNKAVDFIESASHHLNPSVQAGRRPWILVGGAVAVGFLAGLLEQRRRTSGVYSYYPPDAAGAEVMPSGEQRRTERPSGVYPFYGRQSGRQSGDQLPNRPARNDRTPHNRAPAWISDIWRPLFSLWEEVADELTRERHRLQKAALHAGHSFIHDAARIAGETLLDQLSRTGSPSPREGRPRTRYE